jgi:protein SCO1
MDAAVTGLIRSPTRCAALPWLLAAIIAAVGSAHGGRADAGQDADYFPNVTFTTHDGASVRFYDDLIKGKIVAINLIYTTCEYACPLETAKLAQVQRLLGARMGRDIFFYSITIDPEHDTPAVLKEYANKYRAGPGWLFLTGTRVDIERVSKTLGLFSERDRSTADGHVPYLLVGNQATGQWMRNSAMDNPAFMARTIGDWLDSWQTAPREPLQSYADVPRLTFSRGQYTFATHCAACHTIGRGDHIGPDLLGVTTTRDRAWLSRFIVEPDRVVAEGDPIALSLREKYKQVRMPNLSLNDQDAAAILDYLDAQSRDAESLATPDGADKATESAVRGERIDLRPIIEPYLRIQQALQADDLGGIYEYARAIAAAAVQLGTSAHAVRSIAADFKGITNLPAARAVFGRVSEALIALAKQRNAVIGDDITLAFCPMAQQQWLQRGEQIRNPFYGPSMLTCGRIIR